MRNVALVLKLLKRVLEEVNLTLVVVDQESDHVVSVDEALEL